VRIKRDRVFVFGVIATVAALVAGPVRAQRAEPLPAALVGVGITERPGAQVPLDLELVAEDGTPVRLGAYFERGRPVVLTLVYYQCPMLCGLVLQGVTDGLKGLEWTPGREFEVVTVSINPLETAALARLKKQTNLAAYGRPEAAAGWHFLTGREAEIRRLADAVGFSYRWDDTTEQYVHAAGIFVLSPAGTLARTLFGVVYEPRTLRLALTEAGEGTVGTTADRILLTCYHYDPDAEGYVLAASNVMRLGGVTTALVLGVWIGGMWWRGARRGVVPRGGRT